MSSPSTEVAGGAAIRIPIESDDEVGSRFGLRHAPFLGGVVEVQGHQIDAIFLVDTGADATQVNGATIGPTIAGLWGQGEGRAVKGVGGMWPMEIFDGATFVVSIDEENEARLPLPTFGVLAPYLDDRGHAHRRGPVGGTRRAAEWEECTAPNLLGRDVFTENELLLHWDPLGESYMEQR